MNMRTLIAPSFPPATPTAPAPEAASATAAPRVAKKVAAEQHPLETAASHVPDVQPALAQPQTAEPEAIAADEADVAEVDATQHPGRATIWSRLTGMLGRSDRPKRERPAPDHDDHREDHANTKRPDFLLDAAMAREMYRL